MVEAISSSVVSGYPIRPRHRSCVKLSYLSITACKIKPARQIATSVDGWAGAALQKNTKKKQTLTHAQLKQTYTPIRKTKTTNERTQQGVKSRVRH